MQDDLIKQLGGPTAVARMTGVKVPTVIGWKGRIPDNHCPAIELAAGFAEWPCERLRPDVTWGRTPDPDWPHPNGRPFNDHARAAMARQTSPVVADHPTAGTGLTFSRFDKPDGRQERARSERGASRGGRRE
ncbi:MAG TPA: YdaS family helix-turn-helix protein [Ramlibacter sp.]|nr:YdaS family helix-turn-helix protein [Candidatus Limnocylindrales bacterium]HYF41596.1 YdaS family helix-turn-helix protein [Ramlibacter sp.]